VTTAEKLPAQKLPVPVLDYPHWRVTYRPETYDENRIPTLSDCLDVVTKNRVSLRGWDFPHISKRNEIEHGSRWIASWSDFMGHMEYWRFYQSTQFLYLGSVREVTETEWSEHLRATQHFVDKDDIANAPGFISITNFVYNITEIFEFATRLAQAAIYREPVEIAISLTGIRGFLLAADPNRVWPNAYAASQSELAFRQSFTPADLVADAATSAVACTVWFFERFGWLNPNVAVIRSDQQKFLAGRL
jgi:hypothetical protein